MKVNANRQNLFILCCSFLIAVSISCNNQGQSNKEIVQAKNNNQPFESKIDTTILKYTTGVRSILENSKGNIWFANKIATIFYKMVTQQKDFMPVDLEAYQQKYNQAKIAFYKKKLQQLETAAA